MSKTERLLLIGFIIIFSLILLPSAVKRLLPAPRVIKAVPATLSINVPIDTSEIKFVFSQSMKDLKNITYQGMRISAQPKWLDEHRKTLVLSLSEPLKPGAFYRIVLNRNLGEISENDNIMKGRWGKPLGKYVLTFMTAPSEAMQRRIEALKSGMLQDTDKDGLDNRLEAELGTLSTTADTDMDGLTDYEEYCKYKTDPTSVDSDGDSIPDSSWDERREYTYSIRVLLELKPPWNLDAMNDLFQDARVVGAATGNQRYSRVEVIVYPYASPVLLPTVYPDQSASQTFRKYLQPTHDLNYSDEMQSEIRKMLSGATHTLDVLARLQHEIGQMKLTTPLYAPFIYTYMKQGKLVVDEAFFQSMDRKVPQREVEKALSVNYYADSMFKQRRHGACISRARLFASMLRAVGIPARVTMGVPMLYYYKGTGEWNRLIKNLNNEEVSGNFAYDIPTVPNEARIVGHSQVEAYLNNHWIRLGYQLNEGPLFAGTNMIFIKIIDAANFSEIDFTKTWAPLPWIKERPYRTVELSDQAAKYN